MSKDYKIVATLVAVLAFIVYWPAGIVLTLCLIFVVPPFLKNEEKIKKDKVVQEFDDIVKDIETHQEKKD